MRRTYTLEQREAARFRSERNRAKRTQEQKTADASYQQVYSYVRRGELNSYHAKWRKEHPEVCLLRAAKQRAKRANLPFTITLEDIVIPSCCPLLGLELKRSDTGWMTAESPSLDRIRPELGYVPGNVWVISNRANTIKNNATLEELRQICAGLKRKLHCE